MDRARAQTPVRCGSVAGEGSMWLMAILPRDQDADCSWVSKVLQPPP